MKLSERFSTLTVAVLLMALAALAAVPAAAGAQSRKSLGDFEGASRAPGLSVRLAALTSDELRGRPAAVQSRALGLAPRGAGSLLRDDRRVIAEARVSDASASVRTAVRGAGAEITHTSDRYDVVTVSVPIGRLPALARLDEVLSVTEVLTPMTSSSGSGSTSGPTTSGHECSGAKTSEGDQHLKAHDARQAFGFNGSGAKVGVLSDTFDRATAPPPTNAAGDVASGDLPGPGNPCGRTDPVEVLDEADTTGSDEGRAMAQIVHDLAPGAKLSFATAFDGLLPFADNVRALAAAGAGVIVDDVTYFVEPFFQEGPVGVAISDVTAAGAIHYSSAGNSNEINAGNDIASWEAPAFRTTSCPAAVQTDALGAGGSADCLDFDPGVGTDNRLGLTIPGGSTVRFILQWAEPWEGVTSDIDLYALAGAAIVASSIDANPGAGGTQRPFEFVALTNVGVSDATADFVINRFDGSGTPRIKGIFAGISASEYPTSSGSANPATDDIVGPTIFSHNGGADAVSTAAVRFNTTTQPEPFSSRGPVRHYFGPVQGATPAPAITPLQLAKPDLAATDGGANTFFGQDAGGGTFRFFGTSAAAPHAAAVAALQLDKEPQASPAQILAAQTGSAAAVGPFGPAAVGAGLVDAVGAVTATPDLPPPAPTLTATSPAPPSTSTTPKVLGSAQADATVNLFDATASGACTGTPIGSGSAAELAGAGIEVTVPADQATQIRATATDSGGASACSAPLSYTHDGSVDANVKATARQRLKKLAVKVRAFEAIAAVASGKVKVRVARAKRSATAASDGRELRAKRSTFKLRKARASLGAGERAKLRLRPARKDAKRLARLIRRGAKATAKIRVRLTDDLGNRQVKRLKVKLR